MKRIIIAFILLFFSFSVYSQEVDLSALSKKKIMKLINEAIENRDEVLIDYMGSLGPGFPDYSEYENYILEKAYEVARSNEVEFAQKMVEAVLFNNLENKKAQDLYKTIINLKIELEDRRAEEARRKEVKKVELERAELIIEEEIKQDENMTRIIKQNNELINVINSYTGEFEKAEYTSNSHFYPILTNFYMSEAYDAYVSRDPEYNQYKGIGGDFGLGHKYSIFNLRSDFNVNVSYKDDLLAIENKQILALGSVSFGLNANPFPIYLRGGFFLQYYYFNGQDSDVAITNLRTPTAGIGITGLNILGLVRLDLSSDLILAPLYTEDLDLAIYSRFNASINMFRIGTNDFEIKIGLDHLYLSEAGLTEMTWVPRFGVGISNYE